MSANVMTSNPPPPMLLWPEGPEENLIQFMGSCPSHLGQAFTGESRWLMWFMYRNLLTSNDEARALSEALKTNSTSTTLNLWMNSVGDNGTLAVAKALKTDSALTTLKLSANSIGSNGTLAMAEALKTNSTLTTLHADHSAPGPDHLQRNRTTDTCFLYLSRQRPSLHSISGKATFPRLVDQYVHQLKS
ncbi:hypothetical protein BGZ97_008004 [Linnemannia gamsii]|uniref:RNI-like protein n=1 Tax=Linnemannia gamsii TaxID=64522 RepID=A0A9P6QRL6_9FUNG|nr:hypothetical protein BGZ97_008004 [Linnemannia gamsii]